MSNGYGKLTDYKAPKQALTKNEFQKFLKENKELNLYARFILTTIADRLTFCKEDENKNPIVPKGYEYESWQSRKTIAEITTIHRQTVGKYIEAMVEAGLLIPGNEYLRNYKNVQGYYLAAGNGKPLPAVLTTKTNARPGNSERLQAARKAKTPTKPGKGSGTYDYRVDSAMTTGSSKAMTTGQTEAMTTGSSLITSSNNHEVNNQEGYHAVDSAGAPSPGDLEEQDNGNDPASLISEGNEVAGEARNDPEPSFIAESNGEPALCPESQATPYDYPVDIGAVKSYGQAHDIASQEGCASHFRRIYSESREKRTDWGQMLAEARVRQQEDLDVCETCGKDWFGCRC